jgi:hypothetical protein
MPEQVALVSKVSSDPQALCSSYGDGELKIGSSIDECANAADTVESFFECPKPRRLKS